MPYVRLPDLEMFYEEIGIGEPVLFLHSSFNRGFLAFSAQLMAFQSRFHCFLPDMRGHGRSRSKRLTWTVDDLADDIPRLMDALSIPAAHVIGYSLGGTAALYGAVRYPGRFLSLVTIGAGARTTSAAAADQFEPEALEARQDWGFIELMEANHREAHGGDWRGYVRQTLENWRRYPALTAADLARITAPALFIAGAQDTGVPEEELAFMAEHVHGARYAVIDGCGHRPHMVGNQPEQVNDLILRFLERR